MKNKQKLLPFNLEEAKKNPERIVYRNNDIKIIEKVFLTTCDNIIIIDEFGDIFIYDKCGICVTKNEDQDLKLLPVPDKITKTYQYLIVSGFSKRIFVCGILYKSKAAARSAPSRAKKIAIQETTYNHTTGEISIKIVHKY